MACVWLPSWPTCFQMFSDFQGQGSILSFAFDVIIFKSDSVILRVKLTSRKTGEPHELLSSGSSDGAILMVSLFF